MATKSSLRRLIAEKLKTLENTEIQRQSREVFSKLVGHAKFKNAKQISLYLSTNLEVDTIEILRYALEIAKKRCFVPYIDAKKIPIESTRMIMVELKSMQSYEEMPVNRFGIKEMVSLTGPNNEKLTVASPSNCDLDLIIVPGVAFSLDGRRLGHGRGYYDEFLWDWQRRSTDGTKVYTIGLALREQLVDNPPTTDTQDYTLDEIIVADRA
jgi:5-formyltetrahydrofolate cyclo-ligase